MDPSGVSFHAMLKTEIFCTFVTRTFVFSAKKNMSYIWIPCIIHERYIEENTQTLSSQRSALGFEVDITTDTVRLVKSLCVKLVLNIYPRWQRCVSNVNAAFGYATSALYVQDYFAKESKSKVGNTEQTSSLFPKNQCLQGFFYKFFKNYFFAHIQEPNSFYCQKEYM